MNILKKSQEKVNNPSPLLKIIFYFLIWITIATIFAIGLTNIPGFMERYKILIIINAIVTFSLAIALIFLSIREKIDRLLKKFLILTGASVVGYPVISILTAALGADYTLILVSVFIRLIAFLIGVIGSILLFPKTRKLKN